MPTPSGTRRSSASAIIRSPSARPLCCTSRISMPSNASSAASNAVIDSICGVEHSIARMPSARCEIVAERKRRRMREPAGERLVERGEMPLGDIDMRRRARPAVQELVAAADREIGAVRIEPQFDRAARMREVPHDQRALGVRGGRYRRHVLDLGGAIVDVGELDHRRVVVDRGRRSRRPARSAASAPSCARRSRRYGCRRENCRARRGWSCGPAASARRRPAA